MQSAWLHLSYKRVFVALFFWILSVPSIAMYSGIMAGGINWILREARHPNRGVISVLLDSSVTLVLGFSILILYAWFAFVLMTFAWVNQKELSRWLPISGIVSVLLGLLAFAFSAASIFIDFYLEAVVAFPSIAFAAFIYVFHSRQSNARMA
jgi:hypothetical protein